MEIRRGIAVSPGVAIGPARVLDTEGVRIPHRTVAPEQIPEEIARLRQSLREAAADARETAFEDESFRSRIEHLIQSQNFSAEYAVTRGIREYVKRFEEAGSKLGE